MATASDSKRETLKDWKVAILCTLLIFIYGGLQRTGTLFFVECVTRYNVNREKASIPFTMSYLFLFLIGPFIGYLGNHFQIRTIIIFGSILSSIGVFANFWADDIIFLCVFWGFMFGTGIIFALALIQEILNRHFDKHLSTAFGLYLAGSSVGGAVISFVAKALLDHYGLSGTFLILGGITLNTIPIALSLPVYPPIAKPTTSNGNSQSVDQRKDIYNNVLDAEGKDIFYISHYSQSTIIEEKTACSMKSKPVFGRYCYTVNPIQKKQKQSSTQKESFCSSFSIFLNPTFLAICSIQSCFLGVVAILNIILVDLCLEKGVTQHQKVYVLMVVSGTDIVGRLALGWIIDCGFIKNIHFLVATYVLLGVSCLMYMWSNGFVMCMVTSALFGTLYGMVVSYAPKLIKDYIDPRERTMAVASKNFFFSPFAIAMPFILGYFKDTVQSYNGLMYVLVALCIFDAALTLTVPHLAKRQQNLLKFSDQLQK